MDIANVFAIPPVTRAWIGSIVVISSACSLNLLNPMKLHYLPGMWPRLFTTFSTWGNLSFVLLIQLLYLRSTCGGLERPYQIEIGMFPRSVARLLDDRKRALLKQKLEAYKSLDFAWFLGQIALSAVVAFHLQQNITGNYTVTYWAMGHVLDNILLYISGKLSPNEGFTLFILIIKKRYAFWAYGLASYLFTDEFLLIPQIYAQFGLKLTIEHIITGPFLWCTIFKMLVGHFWWFVRFYLLGDIYNEIKTESREAWLAAFDPYETRDPLKEKLQYFVSDVLRFIVLPPWYAFIVPKLVNEE